MSTTFKSLLNNRNYINLWIAQCFAALAEGMWIIIMPLVAFNITGTEEYIGIVAFFMLLPFIFGVFAGPIIDKYNLKKILIVCDINRVLLILIFIYLLYIGYVNIVTISIFVLLMSFQSVFFEPGKMSLVPKLISEINLEKGTSLLNTTVLIIMVVGQLIAGIIFILVDYKYIFLFTMLLFGLSAFFISKIDYKCSLNQPKSQKNIIKSNISEMLEVAQLVSKKRNWVTIILLCVVVNFLVGALPQFLLPIVSLDRFDDYSLWFSILVSSFFIGMIFGNVFVIFKTNSKNLVDNFFLIIIFISFSMILLYFPLMGLESLILFAIGFFVAYLDVSVVIYFQKVSPPEFTGRIFALVFSLVKIVEPISVFLFTVILFIVPYNIAFIIVGIITSSIFLILRTKRVNLFKKRKVV